MKKIIFATLAVAAFTTAAHAGGSQRNYTPVKAISQSAAQAISGSSSTAIARGGNGGSVNVQRSAPGFGISGASGGKGTWHFGAAISTPAGGGAILGGGTERHQKCIDRAEFVIKLDGRAMARNVYAECEPLYKKARGQRR